MCHLPVCHAGILIKLGVSGAGRMPTKSATGDPRCSRLEPKRREVPANAPVGSGHRVLWANWPATTVYQKGWYW